MTAKVTLACEFKCRKCTDRQAVAFWPCIDPDIPSHPYCQECLDEIKREMLISMADDYAAALEDKESE